MKISEFPPAEAVAARTRDRRKNNVGIAPLLANEAGLVGTPTTKRSYRMRSNESKANQA